MFKFRVGISYSNESVELFAAIHSKRFSETIN